MPRMTSAIRSLLKSVSRSFYLSLRILPPPIQLPIGLGYLLCRMADTIADTDAVPPHERTSLLTRFSDLLNRFPLGDREIDQFQDSIQSVNLSPSSPDGILISNLARSLRIFRSLSRTDQALIQNVVRSVIEGMLIDLNQFGDSAETLKAFANREELETYIGFIGGEPGRFWTKVCLDHYPRLKIKEPGPWLVDGILFGTGLQMVNILRDISADLKRGRCYIPEKLLQEQSMTSHELLTANAHPKFLPLYHRLIDETIKRMESGFSYLQQIPVNSFRLRMAVWLPLTLGLQTLALLRNNFFILDSTRKKKVPRWKVYGILMSSLFVLWVPSLLNLVYSRLKEDAS